MHRSAQNIRSTPARRSGQKFWPRPLHRGQLHDPRQDAQDAASNAERAQRALKVDLKVAI